jgi:hypothetical protein
VKETSFLLAVQRIVTGIQIDDDLLAMLGQAAHPICKRVSSIASWLALILWQRFFLLLPSSSRLRVAALANALR